MKILRTGLLLAVLGAIAPALALAGPDFSGTWVFNAALGKNLGMMAAIQETLTIVQTPGKLTVESVRGTNPPLVMAYERKK